MDTDRAFDANIHGQSSFLHYNLISTESQSFQAKSELDINYGLHLLYIVKERSVIF